MQHKYCAFFVALVITVSALTFNLEFYFSIKFYLQVNYSLLYIKIHYFYVKNRTA